MFRLVGLESFEVEHKRQHWIPQSYLSAWCDPNTPTGQEPYVWVFPKNGGQPVNKAPKNLFEESELYTVIGRDGIRDIHIEKSLSKLEDRFAAIRRNVIDRRLPVNEEDSVILSMFTCAMLVRTPKHREHSRKLWADLNRKAALINSTPEDEREKFAGVPANTLTTFTDEEVGQIATRPMQSLFESSVCVLLEIVTSMSLAILEADGFLEFITCDAPAWIADPDTCFSPSGSRHLSLIAPNAELNLPISPTRSLHFNRRGLSGYIKIPGPVVVECNREVRAHAKEFTVQTHQAL